MKLEENNDKYLRFYKKYLFWQLVSENSKFCEDFEKSLKDIKFVPDANLRYEYLPNSLKKNLRKKIQQIVYNKEASDLKVSPEKDKLSGTGTSNHYNSLDKVERSDSFSSWRKKSNDLTSERDKKEKSNKEIEKMNSNPRFNDNFKTSSFNDVPIKRERFNSDGDKGYGYQGGYNGGNQGNGSGYQGYNNDKPKNYTSYFCAFQNPIKLDYSKLNVNYNTESIYYLFNSLVKYKFNQKEFVEIYEKITSEQTTKPDFSLFVEDVCNDFKKINLQILTKNRMVILIY